MVPAHNNQQQEKKDNRFDLRREEERKKARQQDNKEMIGSAKGEKMVSKHGVWSQYAATNNKRRKTTVLV
jgi:hypothetical protein